MSSLVLPLENLALVPEVNFSVAETLELKFYRAKGGFDPDRHPDEQYVAQLLEEHAHFLAHGPDILTYELNYEGLQISQSLRDDLALVTDFLRDIHNASDEMEIRDIIYFSDVTKVETLKGITMTCQLLAAIDRLRIYCATKKFLGGIRYRTRRGFIRYEYIFTMQEIEDYID